MQIGIIHDFIIAQRKSGRSDLITDLYPFAIITVMKTFHARISELFSTSEGPGARIECSCALLPAVGQYLLTQAEAVSSVLPVPLFPQAMEGNELVVAPPVPREWYPGMELSLRGPLGHGFHLPPSCRHLLLADLTRHHGQRLLGLAQMRQQPLETVLLSDIPPLDLPLQIEVLPLSAMREILAWADFIAVELSLPQRNTLKALAGIQALAEFPTFAEALVDTPLPCAGIARCGVCSVRVNHRWALACKDGPVFRLNALGEDQ